VFLDIAVCDKSCLFDNASHYFCLTGYAPMHYASAWGRIGALKVLVEYNANLQQRTANNERPREIAARYNQTECVDFLDWAGNGLWCVWRSKASGLILKCMGLWCVSKSKASGLILKCIGLTLGLFRFLLCSRHLSLSLHGRWILPKKVQVKKIHLHKVTEEVTSLL
jgi:hypothetical protein